MSSRPIGPMPSLAPSILLTALDAIPDYALGSENRLRQAYIVRACLEQRTHHPELVALAVAMATWSWQSRPLNIEAIQDLLTLANAGIALPPALMRILTALHRAISPPEDTQLWNQLRIVGDTELIDRFWDTALKAPRSGLYWLDHVFTALVALPDHSRSRRLLVGAAWPAELEPIRLRLLAEMAWHHGDTTRASALLSQLPAGIWSPWTDMALAAMARNLGETTKASTLTQSLWQRMPWHVNMTLVTHDLVCTSPSADNTLIPAQPSEAAVLMYSYNNASLLKHSLDSLAASNLGAAPLLVLNNGSGDDTKAVLNAAVENFDRNQLNIIHLPTNIGAPGARNWLLMHDIVKTVRYAVFLDDDVVVPADWLTLLLQQARRYPHAGAVGVKIRDAAPPHCMQSADINLLSQHALAALGDDSVFKERILLFDNCAGSLDTGLFDYTRPCLSVSGCCHAIYREAIEAAGPFDIRFNPTQFDDLDRDLRSFLAGFPAVYAGSATIGHVQGSSLAKSKTTAAVANVRGNNIKLENAYDDVQITSLAKQNSKLLADDIRAKVHALQEAI
ncbi:glycosyltransferase family 2 protein [Desulfovibrio inopinatus]|uniref:glycosyltransferase family 2 protein n=1 Tax=Desulfovibrio inopinatus TaxID=102109 RepID=UPI0006885514|nr:glycosyltransferase family 2 protein [Desulfovibrio inopinatus]